jgi:hypothetical protein
MNSSGAAPVPDIGRKEQPGLLIPDLDGHPHGFGPRDLLGVGMVLCHRRKKPGNVAKRRADDGTHGIEQGKIVGMPVGDEKRAGALRPRNQGPALRESAGKSLFKERLQMRVGVKVGKLGRKIESFVPGELGKFVADQLLAAPTPHGVRLGQDQVAFRVVRGAAQIVPIFGLAESERLTVPRKREQRQRVQPDQRRAGARTRERDVDARGLRPADFGVIFRALVPDVAP